MRLHTPPFVPETRRVREGAFGMAIGRWFRRDASRPLAADLYIELVERARQPHYFSDFEIPDSPEGRFEMIAIHAVLIIRRLQSLGKPGERLAQALFDHMFSDMDVNLRELGVGDFGVGRRVKRMAQAFYGRAAAYGAALDSGDREAMSAALARNVYATAERVSPVVAALADDVFAWAAAIECEKVEDLLQAKLRCTVLVEDER